MKRARRIGLIILGVLVVLGLAARWYLSSKYFTAQVASHLAEAYGGPLQIDQVDVGLSGSSARGLRLFEQGASAPKQPWLLVQEGETDVSLWGLLRGQVMPKQLTLSGAAVTLRLDRQGHLLTRFPRGKHGRHVSPGAELPTLHLRDSRLTLHQEGRPKMVIQGIEADLHASGKKLVLSGRVVDPTWKDWTLSGHLDLSTEAISLVLKAPESVHVTRAMLAELPFVPASVWKEVQIEGDTTAEITFHTDPGTRTMHYRVSLAPRNATVFVSSIDLHAQRASGGVIIEDGLVLLRNVKGHAFDGTIHLDADLDFRGKASRLAFHTLAVRRLNVADLPDSWHFPKQIKGRLSGKANLVLTVADGQVHTGGHGAGKIANATVLGRPTTGPIRLSLHGTPEGFKFSQDDETTESKARWTRPPAAALALLFLALPIAPASEPAPPPDRVCRCGDRGPDVLCFAPTRRGTLPALLSRARLPKAPAAKPKQPRYLDVNLRLDNVDLAALVRDLKVALPFPVSGVLSIQIRVGIPLDTPKDMKTYRLHGKASLKRFALADLQMEQVRSEVTYANGELRVRELSGRIPAGLRARGKQAPAGTFKGSARMQLVPLGEVAADLTLDDIPLARILSLVPGAGEKTAGTFSGNIRARVAGAQLAAVNAWEVSGTIQSKWMRAYGLKVEKVRADLSLDEGVVTLADAGLDLEGAPVSGWATLRLAGRFPFLARVMLRRWNLASLQRLAPEVRPPVAIAGRFTTAVGLQGSLAPLALNTSGTATATSLRVDKLHFRRVRFRWASDADRLTLSDVRSTLYRGELTGRAVVPLRPTVAGGINLRFKDLDVGTLVKDLPAAPVRVEGQAAGTVKGTVSAAAAHRPRALTVQLDLRAPRLRVQGIPAERLQGTVSYQNGTTDYRLTGRTLGGSFEINGQLPAASEETPQPVKQTSFRQVPPAPAGHLRIRGVQLDRLLRALGVRGTVTALRGRLNADLTFRHLGPGRMPVGSGRVALLGLRWRDTELAPVIRASILLRRDTLVVRSLSGTVGGGVLAGNAAISLRRGGRRWFAVRVDGVEASRLLAPWPDLSSAIQGPFNVRLRGTLGATTWHGTGEVALNQEKVFKVEVSAGRIPFDWHFAPSPGRGEVAIRDASAQVALGRVTGWARFTWGFESQLEGQVRAEGIDLRTLVQQFSDSTQLGAGRISGRFDFSGHDIRSVNDVSGTLEASLPQTQALDFPLMRQVTPYLGFGLSTTNFRRGELRARLDRGIVRIQRLELEGQTSRIFIQGTITLRGLLLNLELTANTGRVGISPLAVSLFRLRLPVVGPAPLGLLTQASRYFSNRVIHLRITGTLRSPTIQVEPLSLLSDEALRFFLTRANVPLP